MLTDEYVKRVYAQVEQRDGALTRTLGELNRRLDGLFDAPR